MATRIFRQVFNMKAKDKEKKMAFPLMYCFWGSDSDPISKSDARVLYNANNIICRACRGCQG